MLYEAIFLATCNAAMTNKKPLKLHRECHTFATFFPTCNAYNNKRDGGRAKSPTSWALIGPFFRGLASCRGDVTRKQLVSQRCEMKRFVLLFLQLATQRLHLQNGVFRVIFFLQLAMQRLLRCKLREKLLRVTWPLETAGARTGIDTYSLLFYCPILVRKATWDSYLCNIAMIVRVYSYREPRKN